MTTHNNHAGDTKPGQSVHPVRDHAHCDTCTQPSRMPAGGWFREVATNENWRTTTIVQRHRDSAVITPSS